MRDAAGTHALNCEGLSVTVAGRCLVRELSLSLSPGDTLCVLGPNGVGKTLTLHTLAGARAPAAGRVLAGGDPVAGMPRRELARRIGLMLQVHEDPFPITVLEAAMLGGYARGGLWQRDDARELGLAREALARVDLDGLAQRYAATLSGGERRRLAMATLLVQDPSVLLLDEPGNHLDPLHEAQMLARLKSLAASGKAVVATLHDPGVAARWFDRALLLHGDGRWELGPAAGMLSAERLENLYGMPFVAWRRGAAEIMLPEAAAAFAPPAGVD